MLISASQLKDLPVFTFSGQKLGYVLDLEIEVETQIIANLIVKRGILGKQLIINRNQIKSFTAEKIIVDDTVVGVEGSVQEKQYESPAVNY